VGEVKGLRAGAKSSIVAQRLAELTQAKRKRRKNFRGVD